MDTATVVATKASLVGVKWEGTVTDAETGDTAAYSWYCDNVLWDGFSDRLRVVLNNGAGAYREFAFNEGGLDGAGDIIREALEADVAVRLAAERWQDMVGEVL